MKYIDLRILDLIDVLSQKEDKKDIHTDIVEKISDLLGYLEDYRIELMNSLLGDIFPSKVPCREPRDPNIKCLSEVAIKEEVEKEFKERGEAYFKN